MNQIIKIILFLGVNIVGSFIGPAISLLFILGGLLGNPDDVDPYLFQEWFITRTFTTWLICALFSFAWFYYENNWRWFFLLAPIVAPLLYGFILLALV